MELTNFDQNGSELISRTLPASPGRLSDASYKQPDRLIGVRSDEAVPKILPRGRSWIVITQLAGINFITSFSNGYVTVGLPAISTALQIQSSLLLWPMSAYALTTGSCLLLAGAIADVVGNRSINLAGCFLIAIFILVTGFSQTGIQLILFRAMQGLGGALALPSAFSIISKSVESGQPRNVGFATLGLAQPLGFSFGLVLGGVFVSGPGWRTGFYVGGGVGFLLFALGIWALPLDVDSRATTSVWRRLILEIDWVGAILASSSLAVFSYVLAMLSADVHNIQKPTNIVLLTFSLLLVPAFGTWMWHREKLNKSALIPNSMWKKTVFTSICIMVLLSTAVINCMELFSSLFFQNVQGHSALGASIRILPNVIIGIFINFLTGWFVNRLPAVYAVLISSGLCAAAPLLMALINPEWPYWYDAFFAQLLSPVSADVLFTVGILIISDVFPTRTQALAGAVFNTVAQLGTSIGLTTMSIISATVTKDSRFRNKSSPDALMQGYRDSFWTLFAWMGIACLVGALGLRNLGNVGQKRD